MRWNFAFALLVVAGCVDELIGPRMALRLSASSTELSVGGTVRLDAYLGTEPLLPGTLEWLSRDPSTVTVKDGTVRGVFPGTAWVLALRRNAVDSVLLTVRFDDLAIGQAGIRSGGELLRLTGRSTLTQDATDASSYYTTIIASSGGVTAAADGTCCRIGGDTVFQLNYVGRVSKGQRVISLADVRIEDRLTQMLTHTGPDDLLLLIRDGGFSMRFYFPVRPATLEITDLVEPTLDVPGRLHGRMSFEAAGVEQVWDLSGHTSYSPIGDRTTSIYAEFDTPLYLRIFNPRPASAPAPLQLPR